ncbi:hypothetical protein GYA44_02760 [Candidatus Microgenomates bacterium]|nr:hypothetical protein [Candidatus Microgenomates bacterium]
MSFKTQIVLRRIAKIILFFTGLGLALYGGYILYLSIVFRPYNVRISNITDSSFTVSWVTDSPMKGIVYFKDSDSVLPGPLGWISSKKAFDDRDYSDAQASCVNKFNEESANGVSDDFTVNGDNFDCENIEVNETGKYYTHHITLKNLDSEKKYYFKVGDGLMSWGLESSRQVVDEDEYPTATEFGAKTFSVLDSIEEPDPAYGSVVGVVKEGENYREDDNVDALVFARLVSFDTDAQSTLLSSVTNSDGGWYVDKSMVRQEDGTLHKYVKDNDFLYVGYQYKSYSDSKIMMLRLGYEDAPAPEIAGVTEEELKNVKNEDNIFEKIKNVFVKKSSAGCNENGCATFAELMEYRASGNSGASEQAVRQAKRYVNSVDIEAEKARQMNMLSSTANVASSTNENVVGYTKAIDNAVSSNNVTELMRLMNTPGLSTTNPTMYSKALSSWVEMNSTNSSINNNSTGFIGNSGNSNTSSESSTSKSSYQILQDVLGFNASESPDSSTSKVSTYVINAKASGSSKTDDEKSSPSFLSNITKNIAFSDVDMQMKVNFSADATTGKIDLTVGDDSSLSYDAKTEKYQVTSIKGLAQYSVLSFLETAKNIWSGADEVLTKSVKVLPKATRVVLGAGKLQVPKVEVSTEVTSVFGDTSNTKINVVSPIKFQDKEGNEIEGPIFGTLINVAEIGEKSAGKMEEYLVGNVCIEGSSCSESGVNVKTIEVEPKSVDKTSLKGSLVNGVYAEETTTANNSLSGDFLYYTSEKGIVDITVDGVEVENGLEVDGNDVILLYDNRDGVDGYQVPKDYQNPAENEDLILSSNALTIDVKKTSEMYTASLDDGINIVSFDKVLLGEDGSVLKAGDILKKYPKSIRYIASFSGGKWSNIIGNGEDGVKGNDFNIVPGVGYLVFMNYSSKISMSGYKLESPIPVNFSAGWNLVGIHGYSKAFTARSLIDNINTISGLTADNVSWWPTAKGKYEGLQVTDNKEYGLDFPISPSNGYFVRINKFKPEDTSCNSLIWHYGGDLNGKCGNSKTILN